MRHHRTRAFLCLLAACIVLGCRATAIDSRAQRGSGDPAVWRGGRSGRGLQQAAPTPPPGSLTGPQTNCTLPLGANSLRFAACTPINGIGTNFALLWSLHIHPNGTCTIVLGLRAAAGGWSAVGFPTTPGHMLGSTAMVLSTCPTCASGAAIDDRFLAARSPAGVQPPGHLPVWGAAAAAGGDGMMQGTISILFDAAAVNRSDFPLVAASGPIDSGGGMQYHRQRGGLEVNLAAGTASGVQGESDRICRMKNAHGWLMAVGWTLIAVGIVVARHGKAWDPLWFHSHRVIQLLGLACALAGFILIFVTVQQATGTNVSRYTTHRRLGITAMSLGLAQVTALVFRPHKGTRLRPYWEFSHHWIGRSAAVLAIVNVYWGIIRVLHVGAWAVATYSCILGIIVAVGVALDARKLWMWWTGCRERGQAGASSVSQSAEPMLPSEASQGDSGNGNGGQGKSERSSGKVGDPTV